MSRARAAALALVNWRGVFYERYLLDRHVTALEGANGAGKTTVMIAAYVVLLPDLSRLRFTNLGESGATGGDKGIWGRLGAPGRPSYAALEIEVAAGESIVAGVHLERRAEPTLELSPFLISGLDLRGSLRDVLLRSDGDHDYVPVLDEVREAVVRRGGQLEVFATTKEYFAALFDRGVTPLRLATDEDRNKLNEMLRTSMTGGISRALTAELRAFLFKEETGLGDALSRMRGNLDACHRTRIEVAEARKLEQEIAGVYDSGHVMFATALFATRAHAEELGKRAAEARVALEAAEASLRALDADRAEARARHEGLLARAALARAAAASARQDAARAERGHELAVRLAALEPEIAQAAATASAARDVLETVRRRRDDLRESSARARDAHERAARGLADLQAGLDDLHRRAHAQRHVRTQLEHARQALALPDLEPEGAAGALASVRARLAAIDLRRARLDRDAAQAEVRRRDHERARTALHRIAGAVDPSRAHEEARRALAKLSELEANAGRRGTLGEELARSLPLLSRQRAVRARARELGLELDPAAAATRAVQLRLAEADARIRQAEETARQGAGAAAEARRERDEASARLSELEGKHARWKEADGLGRRIESALAVDVRTREDALRARARIADERDAARARVSDLRTRRDGLLRQLATLEASASTFHPDLLRIRDELDAELLAARFEDLDLAEAVRVEGALGALAEALVVDDPAAAAKAIAGKPREIDTVWLVPGGAYDSPAEGVSRMGDDLVISVGRAAAADETDRRAFRVTRAKEQPSLGRRARERRADALRAQDEAMGRDLEAAIDALADVDALARCAEALVAAAHLLEGGDPQALVERAGHDLRAAEAAEQIASASALAGSHDATNLRPRVDALRALLADAFLLDPPDYSDRVGELEASLRAAREAKEELERVAQARIELSELVDALRFAPEEEAHDGTAPVQAALDREREVLFGAREALEDVDRDRHALRFEDAEQALSTRPELVPAMEEQLSRAREALRLEEAALREAETASDAAAIVGQKAQATLEAARAHHARLRIETSAEGASDDVALAYAMRASFRQSADDREAECIALEVEERAAQTRVTLLEERRAHAERALAVAEAKLAQEEHSRRPAALAWESARVAAETASVLVAAMSARFASTYEDRPSASLWPEVRSRAGMLVERLEAARGGAEAAGRVRAAVAVRQPGEVQPVLEAWLAVRDWAKRRLPAQVADVPDPLDALGRLRDGLGALQDRLTRQEADLCGASEDVARGIEVQLRKAKNQVRRLNQNLDGVGFGTIGGIRVQMSRVERMDQVLRALRDGAAQELLFQPNLPIEAALDEIFRRYGGGRGGGQRILDYREYVELTVEIRREAQGDWELATPTRLSTGEAIGVGAALMMVILTEWERDANLLRAKRASGSLRFLFLDEANRLSHDNLGVLFELCKTLDLQLLIAAPEVARAEGNTTYRLVRRVTPEGSEEVLVSGRRTVVAAS
jgi:chromosome partition protein MukB